MRIMFLSTSMGMGGADQQLLSAARELRAALSISLVTEQVGTLMPTRRARSWA